MKTVIKNKTFFITGSSRGIGLATARELAAKGASLVLTYYEDKNEGMAAKAECEKLGAKDILLVHLDLTDDRSIKQSVAKAVRKFGQIHVLVNNAGVAIWNPLIKQSLDEIQIQIRVNLEGLIKITRVALPHIREQIINVASGAGMTGYADLTAYCAAKFGVRGFSMALAQELDSIKVLIVNPGLTATKMTNYRGAPPEQVGKVIYNAICGEYPVLSGHAVNVWHYLD